MGLIPFRCRILTTIDVYRPAASVEGPMENFVVHEQDATGLVLNGISSGNRLWFGAQHTNGLLQFSPLFRAMAPRNHAETAVLRS